MKSNTPFYILAPGFALAPAPEQETHLSLVAAQAQEYAKRYRARGTLRGYAVNWRDFAAWCQSNGMAALPAQPETIALYISAQAETLKVSTIQRRVAAISQTHQLRGFDSPTKSEIVRSVLKGIRRTLGVARNEKAPLLASDVREMVAALPDTLNGKRDRALLLLGFAGAFRRSEIVSLNMNDLDFTDEGLVVTLRRSKTDQEGAGRKIGIPRIATSDACPVAAVRAWIEASGIATGAVFRPVALAAGSAISAYQTARLPRL